ncbi:MAG TPA: acetyl-CoA carboxylase biotin carboxyl carrier protein [Stellaceae bacterium]
MTDQPDQTIDTQLIRTLALLLDETRLTEIEVAIGDRRIRVARLVTSAPAATMMIGAPPQLAAAAGAAGAAPSGVGAGATLADHPGAVKSPMVGTAYPAPEPGAAPFVKVGDAVAEGQVILIIEAMKVMNQIRAPRAGRVTQVLVVDGSPVEYGAVLMIIE